MSTVSRVISTLVALGAGMAIAWVDTRPTWDDTGITAMAVMGVAAAGSLARLPGWLAAVCAAGPLIAAEISGGPAVLISVPFAVVGAYAVVFFLSARRP